MSLCNRSALSLFLLGILAPGVLPAQEPYLVRDINQETQEEKGLASYEVLATSEGFFYSFDDGLHGPELELRHRGGGGPVLFDLCPGPCGSSPRDFAELDDAVYFFADDGTTGLELWRTDGTPGGTSLVRDICPGSCSGWPDGGSSLIVAGDALFFRARNIDGQAELWTSDGTAAGTRWKAGSCLRCNAGIFDLTAVGGSVFFRANDGVHGIEVWRDGELLRDDCPGACSSGPARDLPNLFTPYDRGVFYWQLIAGSTNRWRLRSTAGVPEDHPIELDQEQGPPSGTVIGNALVLTAGSKLARIDIPTFTLAVVRGFGAPLGPVMALGNAVFFAGDNELWRSDGTVAGTKRVEESDPDGNAEGPRNLVVAAGKLFFTNNQGVLWVSDGTAFGTRALDRDRGVYLKFHVDGLTPDPPGKRLLFAADKELWETDGTFLYPVRSINLEIPGSASLRSLTAFQGTLFFVASEGYGIERLWRSDGTEGGTQVLRDVRGVPEDLAPFQGGLVLRSGTEIWQTDGSARGTRRILNQFNAELMKVIGDRLFFSGFSSKGPDAFSGFELWSSDGTFAYLIKDIDPGYDPTPDGLEARSSRPRQLTMVGSTLFFVADSPEEGTELWVSDGTTDGTEVHLVECVGPCSSNLHLLASFAGRLFFTSGKSRSLLSTRPGELGIALPILSIGYSTPDPVVFQGRLFFFSENRLWSSDGTAPGTVPIQVVSGPDQPQTAHEPTVVGDRLYFTSWTEATGQELWVSDGTASGTNLVADLRPGPQSSAPRYLTAVGERLFFSADDGKNGHEIWMTDGTQAGSRRVTDMVAGLGSATPVDLTAVGDRLYFSAEDGEHGRELWALDTAQLFAYCTPAADRLCLGGRRFEVTVSFLSPVAGGISRPGTAIPDSDQSGFFWFFAPANLELVVKVLDGRYLNGHFWVLFGALSDVDYTVTVKDHATGTVRTYHNPPGSLCGQADTTAFPDPDGATAPSRAVAFDPLPATAAAGPCLPGPSALCLRGGRFRVEARWQDQHNDRGGAAVPVPRTAESGTFWFFNPGNTELVVKVLDGTPINGKFWIFYGALSDVEYWLTVTDTVTGAAKTYHNPPGNYCGNGDTEGL